MFQIAYGIAKVVTSDPLASLGIFVAGICPGGGASNIYSYLLDGDLSLSITMTTISTILSLGKLKFTLSIRNSLRYLNIIVVDILSS